ncbi:hypothetical protein T440DRAFT_476476 [Plenodomus tracheiphilus IPT5]|uniref:BZIP domain-containing protein n=1 Tax=Plenodomus tracheiphilus IPT5 TaxID=1408161 RepID=A0A6A7BH94_9PLEO|nr:hypothetical protein T440DRAFT_476476 [Plenodomus tracheiphilus IPT5]
MAMAGGAGPGQRAVLGLGACPSGAHRVIGDSGTWQSSSEGAASTHESGWRGKRGQSNWNSPCVTHQPQPRLLPITTPPCPAPASLTTTWPSSAPPAPDSLFTLPPLQLPSMTEIETPHSFDWAHDAYTALNDKNNLESIKQQANGWPFSAPDPSHSQAAFAIPPSLLSHATIERYGQVTPPEEHSPAEPLRRSSRESSIPVEQLRNETLWPEQRPTPEQIHVSPHEEQLKPSPKRQRTSRQASANQPQANPTPQQDFSTANPQPPKRKRGRPKAQPQMVEAYTADGFPFQVSSARQSHLEKNRVAAHKCRQRKKEYINGLEGRARDFSNKNKMLKENVAMLREEVLGLKNEVLRHAGCGFWAVDEYLARCAGDLLGMEAPSTRTANSRHDSNQGAPMAPMVSGPYQGQHDQADDTMSFGSHDSDEFGGLELLKDFDDEDMDELEKII